MQSLLGPLGAGFFSYDNASNDTILQALQKLGFISTISADPLSKLVNNTVSSTSQDYLLVRCCKDGRQAIGTGGSLFAIWAKLESGGSAQIGSATDANSQHLCGGPAVTPPNHAPYHYVFGAGTNNSPANTTPTIGAQDSYDPAWFAVGNAPVNNSTSLNDSCNKSA